MNEILKLLGNKYNVSTRQDLFEFVVSISNIEGKKVSHILSEIEMNNSKRDIFLETIRGLIAVIEKR